MISRAFVAGATGYTGRSLVERLRAKGVRTIAHVRPDSSELDAWRTRFASIGADVDTTPWQPKAIKARLAELKPGFVFAALGTTRKRAKEVKSRGGNAEDESYMAVDYGLSAMLLNAARAQQPTPPRFIYVSAMGVRPDAQATGGYVAARARLEAELIDSGLSYAIARPGFIAGDREEERPLEAMAAQASNTLLGWVGAIGGKGLRDTWTSITGAQLARALVVMGLDRPNEDLIFDPRQLRNAGGANRQP